MVTPYSCVDLGANEHQNVSVHQLEGLGGEVILVWLMQHCVVNSESGKANKDIPTFSTFSCVNSGLNDPQTSLVGVLDAMLHEVMMWLAVRRPIKL